MCLKLAQPNMVRRAMESISHVTLNVTIDTHLHVTLAQLAALDEFTHPG